MQSCYNYAQTIIRQNVDDMMNIIVIFGLCFLKNESFLQRAIEEGADFIETDILSSKDGVLVCFHDVTLDNTTDIANRTEFANRKRTYEVQGENMTGFFTGSVAKLAIHCSTSLQISLMKLLGC